MSTLSENLITHLLLHRVAYRRFEPSVAVCSLCQYLSVIVEAHGYKKGAVRGRIAVTYNTYKESLAAPREKVSISDRKLHPTYPSRTALTVLAISFLVSGFKAKALMPAAFAASALTRWL